jgi:polyhydroxyalkanoate synthesis regulator phasin
MAGSRLLGKVKARAVRAVGDLMATERGAAAVAGAMRGVQKGRKVFEEKANELADALGLATRADVDQVTRKVARLRKQVQGLLDQLDSR